MTLVKYRGWTSKCKHGDWVSMDYDIFAKWFLQNRNKYVAVDVFVYKEISGGKVNSIGRWTYANGKWVQIY